MPPSEYEQLRISDRALAQLQRINREVAQIGAPHEVPPLRAARDFVIGNETREQLGGSSLTGRQRGIADAQIGGPLSGANRKTFAHFETYGFDPSAT
jgi:hypothetical protein